MATPDTIFVFGSNLQGIHGKGAALAARQEYGAVLGVGEGRTGNAYALPTKSTPYKTRSLDAIRGSVWGFREYVKANPHNKYLIASPGCGLAGYCPNQIAPMFMGLHHYDIEFVDPSWYRIAQFGPHKFQWSKFDGYECSTKGDKRFSALCATMPDGRTIEQHYQCDVKGYDPGGTNWKLGKGKPPIRECDFWEEYLALWKVWAEDNKPALRELWVEGRAKCMVLSDMFATTSVNQAHALSVILNELCGYNYEE